jgi:hypothetical protein
MLPASTASGRDRRLEVSWNASRLPKKVHNVVLLLDQVIALALNVHVEDKSPTEDESVTLRYVSQARTYRAIKKARGRL